jgi:hypothetical protein
VFSVVINEKHRGRRESTEGHRGFFSAVLCGKKIYTIRQYRKKVILMGINFDTEKRNVAEWKIA